MRILHVFKTQEQMKTFIHENVQHVCQYNQKNEKISDGKTDIILRVIATEQDYMKIAGYRLSCVFWHYTPEPNIKSYVQSIIRYCK